MTPAEFATIITAVAGALGLRELIPRIGKWATGSASRTRVEVDRALTRADRESARADSEATSRRKLAESLSEHRRIIIEAPCLGVAHLPKYPTPTTKD